MASSPIHAGVNRLSNFKRSALLDPCNHHILFKQCLKDLMFDEVSQTVPSSSNMALLGTHFKNLQAKVSPSRAPSDMESVLETTG